MVSSVRVVAWRMDFASVGYVSKKDAHSLQIGKRDLHKIYQPDFICRTGTVVADATGLAGQSNLSALPNFPGPVNSCIPDSPVARNSIPHCQVLFSSGTFRFGIERGRCDALLRLLIAKFFIRTLWPRQC